MNKLKSHIKVKSLLHKHANIIITKFVNVRKSNMGIFDDIYDNLESYPARRNLLQKIFKTRIGKLLSFKYNREEFGMGRLGISKG